MFNVGVPWVLNSFPAVVSYLLPEKIITLSISIFKLHMLGVSETRGYKLSFVGYGVWGLFCREELSK
jgi:hypothetical protein